MHHLHGSRRRLTLHFEPAELIHRLRRQADVPHHGNAGLDEFPHRLRRALAAFELHSAAAGLLHEPRRVLHRVLPAGLVAAERHIADDQCVLRAADYGLSVMQHVVHRHRQRRVITEDHHAERVANENDVSPAILDEPRGRTVVGRHHHDLRAIVLHLDDVGGADAWHIHAPLLNAHASLRSAGASVRCCCAHRRRPARARRCAPRTPSPSHT